MLFVNRYEAALTRRENVMQVEAARRAIEQVGGRVEISHPSSAGVVVVILHLPVRYTPHDFLPGLPFYPA